MQRGARPDAAGVDFLKNSRLAAERLQKGSPQGRFHQTAEDERQDTGCNRFGRAYQDRKPSCAKD